MWRADGVGAGGNALLDALPGQDRALIKRAGRRVVLEKGGLLLVAGHVPRELFFIDRGAVALVEVMHDRRWRDVLLAGREGVVGWPALLGYASEPWTAVVQLPGSALALGIEPLRAITATQPALMLALLRYVGSATAQIGRTAVSNLEDGVDQRLARWLLMLLDRSDGAAIPVTHDRLAELLGVRRPTVTDRLHRLEGDGVLRSTRGLVTVRDRAALEAMAGEAYGVAEARHRALLGTG